MKLFEVTTLEIRLGTLEKEVEVTIRREDEMFIFPKPENLYETQVFYSHSDGHKFSNCTVTRIK